MLNITKKSLFSFPRLTAQPIHALIALNQKSRQMSALRKLDDRALKDIGITAAQRDAELSKGK